MLKGVKYAYIKHGFLHNDLHLDNILMKKTKLEYIKYDDYNIKTEGYKVIIMEYDSSFINIEIDKGIVYFWKNIYNMFSRINTDINNITPDATYQKLMNYIMDYELNNITPNDKEKIENILYLIEKIEFKEQKLKIPVYNPNVF